ncbi:MAG: NUDIX domain-containing protein [Acidobacteria bacterium]|nr:NUDIX domain-containing protein [Acidobacteriota bacterium]
MRCPRARTDRTILSKPFIVTIQASVAYPWFSKLDAARSPRRYTEGRGAGGTNSELKYLEHVTQAFVPDNFGAGRQRMLREISAGGVVVRPMPQGWNVAVIEPQADAGSRRSEKKSHKKELLALPKGLIDPGEEPAETAVREVFEETGIHAKILEKLTDIKYVYVRSWQDNERVFKIVSFYLLRYQSGTIDEVSPGMRIEVRRARWLPIEEAETKLAYRGEREVIKLARERLKLHPEEAEP